MRTDAKPPRPLEERSTSEDSGSRRSKTKCSASTTRSPGPLCALCVLTLILVLGLISCRRDKGGAGRNRSDGTRALPTGAVAEAPATGKWRRAQGPAAGPWKRPAGAEAVMTLPYLQGYRQAGERTGGVTIHDEERTTAGLNLYTSGHAAEAVLIDLRGRILHRWQYPLRRFVPDLWESNDLIPRLDYFRRARLLPTGELLAIFEGLGLVKLDPRSRLVWAYRGGVHHDLDLDARGRIWVLDRRGKRIPRIRPDRGVLEDFVTILTEGGEVEDRISLLEALESSPWAGLLDRLPPDDPDLFHTNTLELLDDRLESLGPAFRRGNVLLSIHRLDALAVLDPREEEIVWLATGPWRKQHQPTVIDGGRLLLFDNLGLGRGHSRVMEIELQPKPKEPQVGWSWGEGLWSKTLGSVQRLRSGNTLITESENGRALEITREGKPVWEFTSPHRAGESGELVAVLFEMERLAPDFPFRGLGRSLQDEAPE